MTNDIRKYIRGDTRGWSDQELHPRSDERGCVRQEGDCATMTDDIRRYITLIEGAQTICELRVFHKERVYPNDMPARDVPIINPTETEIRQFAANSMNQRFLRGENVGGDPWMNGYVDGGDDALRGAEDVDGNRYFVDAWWMTHGSLIQTLRGQGVQMSRQRIWVNGEGKVSVDDRTPVTETIETDTPFIKAWLNPSTGREIVFDPYESHENKIRENPRLYGLSREDCGDDMEDHMLRSAMAHGWVRVATGSDAMLAGLSVEDIGYVNADTIRAIQRGLLWLRKKDWLPYKINVEIGYGGKMTTLVGTEADTFIKYGVVQ